uniref:ATP synthase F0 subunit 8 n=1 Tax=Megalocaria dilatata TaxID=511882 RepID=UPI00207A683C|nr:ATP synthase F0 subunit 8 [Megalocaria dilatata]URN72799.1 ATP synthase F0 subunit 8 [Megalocaria dilatata]
MPQTMPMNWLMLFFIFILLFMLIVIIFYFYFNKIPNQKIFKFIKKMSWKW